MGTDMPENNQGAHPAEIDVAGILEGLRAEVRARRLAQGQIKEGPLERDLRRSLDEIELHRVVSAHWPLIGHTPLQRVVMLLNKVVRQYLRWYINPIVEQQNAYNDAVARALRLLAEAYADLAEQIGDRGPGTGDRGPGTRDRGHILPNPQAEVRERAQFEPPAHFSDLALVGLDLRLRPHEQVSAHWPLIGHTPRQRLMIPVHRLVRRYLRWFINPIVEQQNAANAATTAALLAFIRLDAERRAQVAGMRAKTRGQGDKETRR